MRISIYVFGVELLRLQKINSLYNKKEIDSATRIGCFMTDYL